MIEIDPLTENLGALVGAWAKPDTRGGRPYRLEELLASGAMGTAFLARQILGNGERVAVVKVLHPALVKQSGKQAEVAVRKETEALQRLNARVPPTPFVVRSLDHGSIAVSLGAQRLSLPFLALEYVHGGPEGTTLTARVASSIATTGKAFDRSRMVRLIDCLAEGLTAVHEAGVIHRDLKISCSS